MLLFLEKKITFYIIAFAIEPLGYTGIYEKKAHFFKQYHNFFNKCIHLVLASTGQIILHFDTFALTNRRSSLTSMWSKNTTTQAGDV